MSSADFDSLVGELWTFLAPTVPPEPVDVIFVFGGLNTAIPRKAVELYRQGFSRQILVTGAVGPLTKDTFKDSEARVFANEMIALGVPTKAILLEDKATNTAENVSFGMATLEKSGVHPQTVGIVSQPFLTRRALATFAHLYPNVRTIPMPPDGPASALLDRSEKELAHRLVAELQRLEEYANRGFITKVTIPSAVREAADRITNKDIIE